MLEFPNCLKMPKAINLTLRVFITFNVGDYLLIKN